jgi:hypothetical protein
MAGMDCLFWTVKASCAIDTGYNGHQDFGDHKTNFDCSTNDNKGLKYYFVNQMWLLPKWGDSLERKCKSLGLRDVNPAGQNLLFTSHYYS